MGPVRVPKEAYYGAQTQRAVENFPISGWRFGREFLYALGLIKYASAKVNFELGLMKKRIARAIEQASREVMEGRWDEQFVVDVFQTGSGTSTHMNTNEVIANRANEILGSSKGSYQPVSMPCESGPISNDLPSSIISTGHPSAETPQPERSIQGF
jgi:fumarate hydratase class II